MDSFPTFMGQSGVFSTIVRHISPALLLAAITVSTALGAMPYSYFSTK
jgi:hypothetical protein